MGEKIENDYRNLLMGNTLQLNKEFIYVPLLQLANKEATHLY